jgi:hypothetical protein
METSQSPATTRSRTVSLAVAMACLFFSFLMFGNIVVTPDEFIDHVRDILVLHRKSGPVRPCSLAYLLGSR